MSSKTSAIRLSSAQKKLEILRLRAQKKTFEQIGATVGCVPSYAHRIVTQHLDKVNAMRVNETDQMVTQMQADYEEIIRTHWNNRQDPDSAKVIMKAMENLAKLRGLNAADKIELLHQLPAKIEYTVDNPNTTRTPDALPSPDPEAS